MSENFHVSQTGREGFKHVKNFMPIFSAKYVARLSVSVSVAANLRI